jgi:hypothetical protein
VIDTTVVVGGVVAGTVVGTGVAEVGIVVGVPFDGEVQAATMRIATMRSTVSAADLTVILWNLRALDI